jgi:hypothetical protein
MAGLDDATGKKVSKQYIKDVLASKLKQDISKSPMVLGRINSAVDDAVKIFESLPLHGFRELDKEAGLLKFTDIYPGFKKNNPAVVKWMLDGVFDADVFRKYLTYYFKPGERTAKKFLMAQAVYEIDIQKWVAAQRNVRLTKTQVQALEKGTKAAYMELATSLTDEQKRVEDAKKDADRYAASRFLMSVRGISVYDDDCCIFAD